MLASRFSSGSAYTTRRNNLQPARCTTRTPSLKVSRIFATQLSALLLGLHTGPAALHAYPVNNADAATAMGTDPEGFDPVADTVGPGIYSGKVQRDGNGNIVWGRQYENHNPAPGPVYAGGGYTDMARAIHQGPEAVKRLLAAGADPNEIMTGGARPLHTCGMSQRGQLSTQVLIEAGADIEALDTYGYTPLHRMASNNLAIGAEALLRAGADPNRETEKPYIGERPMQIAQFSGAREVEEVLLRYGGTAW